jgi:hypothetical protein
MICRSARLGNAIAEIRSRAEITETIGPHPVPDFYRRRRIKSFTLLLRDSYCRVFRRSGQQTRRFLPTPSSQAHPVVARFASDAIHFAPSESDRPAPPGARPRGCPHQARLNAARCRRRSSRSGRAAAASRGPGAGNKPAARRACAPSTSSTHKLLSSNQTR